MNDFLISTSCQGNCVHPGSILTFKSTNKKVLVEKNPLLISLENQFSDDISVINCNFKIGSTPHPCKTAKWLKVSTKILTNNIQLLLGTRSGVCFADDKVLQSQAFVKSISLQKKVRGC